MRTRLVLPSPRLIGSLLLLALLWLAATAFIPLADTIVYVGELPLNLRSGPGTQFSVVAELQPGEQLKVLSESGGWYNVTRVSTSQTGWVDKSFTQSAPPASVTTAPFSVAVKDVPVNMRSGPGTKYSVLLQLGPGETLYATSRSGFWYSVKRPATGETGYVHVDYVTPIYYDVVANGTVVYVGENPLSLRAGPGPNLTRLAELTPGEALTVTGQAGRWLQVTRQAGGTSGWVHGSYVTTTPPAAPVTPVPSTPKLAYVNTAFLNLRTGPSVSYSVILKMPQGQAVTILSESGGWAYLQLPDGTKGYANSFYIKK